MKKRECGTCTKCCEGYLSGEALGHTFYAGKPCHFIAIGTGCTVYEKRPKDPCVSYKCKWLYDLDIPEWFKPNEINAIVDMRSANGIEYLNLKEAGAVLRSDVLSWIIQYGLNNKLNICWQINGGLKYIGSPEFIVEMQKNTN